MLHFRKLSGLVFLLAICACAPTLDPETTGAVLEEQGEEAAATAAGFAGMLDRHLALPAAEQNTARREAREIAEFWREFEQEAHDVEDSQLRQWYYRDNAITADHRWFGLGNSILELKKATERDPSFAEGWGALGRLCAEAGDLVTARTYLDHARTTAHALGLLGRPVDRDVQLQIYRERAWVLRDLALWDEGLEAVTEGLRFHPGDPDLVLVKGLLLAGSGRYEQAVSLAVRMEPVEYPQYDFIYRGFKLQKSSHANNWIRAVALLAIGDVELAYAKLGDLSVYAYRGNIAHSARYWKDAGLIAELAGDDQAPTYYAVGFVTRHYQQFYPAAANNVAPLVLDLPHPGMPVYTSFGSRFYIAGSPFSYVGLQMNHLGDGLFQGQRNEAAGRALQMLDLLERRNVAPAVCRAFRGRIYYAHDDYGPAETELLAARQAFKARDEVDAGTSLLLGLLKMRNQDYRRAETYLEESLAAEESNPVGWRSLGVVYSRLGKTAQAGQAMTRAVQADPWNVSGLYNRGLYNYQNGQLGPAMADLDRALRIDPENREVQRLRGIVTGTIEESGRSVAEVTAMTEGIPEEYARDPAELLAELEAEIDAFFTVPDSLRLSEPEAEERIQVLMSRYVQFRDPQLRAVLAMALVDHGRMAEVQHLLGPGWGVDLSPEEELILLYADHQVGERARAEQVMRQVLASGDGGGNPYAVALAARTMRTSTDPEAADRELAQNSRTHGFFYWWTNAKTNKAASSMMPKFVYNRWLWLQYKDEPMLEQAVWGMSPTPVQGRSSSVATESSVGTVGK
ncbi:MAG: tetratricopeptide repeat protein [bacterium]